jgi:hypothetical protein
MRCDLGNTSLEEDISVITYGELHLDQWILKGKQKGWLSPLGDTLVILYFSLIIIVFISIIFRLIWLII